MKKPSSENVCKSQVPSSSALFRPGLKKAMGIGDEAAAQAAAENEPKSRLEILTDVERMSSGLITEGSDLISEDLVQ